MTAPEPLTSVALVFDGNDATLFTQVDPDNGIRMGYFSELRAEADRPLTPAEARRLAGLVGYGFRADFRGTESLGDYRSDTNRSVVFYAHATDSQSRDINRAFDSFMLNFPGLVTEGSPVRKTNRTGPKGTRLIEGIPGITVTFWLNNVKIAR